MSESKGKTGAPKFCENCGSSLLRGAVFCQKCGTEVGKPNKQVKFQIPNPSGIFKRTKGSLTVEGLTSKIARKFKSNRRLLVTSIAGFGLAIVVFVVLAFTPGAFSPLNSGQIPKFNDAISEDRQSEVASNLCTNLEGSLPSDSTLSEYENRISEIRAVGTNERAMLAFSNKTIWMTNSSEFGYIDDAISSAVAIGLKEILDSPPIWGVDESNRDMITKAWQKDFTVALLESCGLTDQVASAKDKAALYDRVVNDAVRIAASAPWYPRGYFELVDGLAGKWNTFSGSSPCYDCSFWKMLVVSRDGCPGGVYVEINISQGGTVVDWTNDSLSQLNSGRKGQMIFENYPFVPNAKGEVSDASCY